MSILDRLGSISLSFGGEEQSMFEVGDKVVHPTRGAGVVIGIENKDLIEKFDEYYVIDMVTGRMKLMIPVENAKEIGLRRALKRSKVPQLLNILRGYPDEMPEDYKKRQARVREKLRSGDPIAIAKAVRNLYWRDQEDKLTTTDNKLFDRGKQFLIGELAVAEGIEIEAANKQLEAALAYRIYKPPQI